METGMVIYCCCPTPGKKTTRTFNMTYNIKMYTFLTNAKMDCHVYIAYSIHISYTPTLTHAETCMYMHRRTHTPIHPHTHTHTHPHTHPPTPTQQSKCTHTNIILNWKFIHIHIEQVSHSANIPPRGRVLKPCSQMYWTGIVPDPDS